jgi:hypothetical protein
LVRAKQVGDPMIIEFRRGGEVKHVTATLRERGG